jgi:hypothetical protein
MGYFNRNEGDHCMKALQKVNNFLVVLSIIGGSYFVAERSELYKLAHVLVLVGLSVPIGRSWANSFTSPRSSDSTNERFEYSWLRGAWTSKLLDFKDVNSSNRQKLAKELFDERYVVILVVILVVWIFAGEMLRSPIGGSAVATGIPLQIFVGLFLGYAVIAISAKLIAGLHIIFYKGD